MATVSKTDTGVSPSSILSIVGGALMVLGSLVGLSMINMLTEFPIAGMMGRMMPSSFMWGAVGVMAGVSAGLGAVLIIGGYSIHKNQSSGGWGIAILVASIVGLVTMSGFFIGPIFGIIGGILALTKK